MKLLDAQGGYVTVDHTASPGIPEQAARKMGYEPEQVREGSFYEADSFGCPHCGGVVIKNPARKRSRNVCLKCHSYVCDICAGVMSESDYVHYTINELADKCRDGKFQVVGTSMSRLKLIPVTGEKNG